MCNFTKTAKTVNKTIDSKTHPAAPDPRHCSSVEASEPFHPAPRRPYFPRPSLGPPAALPGLFPKD